MTELHASDIPDDEVRNWYINKGVPDSRRWIFPIYKASCERIEFLKWAKEHVMVGKVVVLALDKEILNIIEENFPDSPIERHFDNNKLDVAKFESILNKHDVNSFFCHASFIPTLLQIRKHLLTPDRFQKTLSLWYEGSFLRTADHKNYVSQFDWLGWNALSSMAAVNWDTLADISENEKEFIDDYMCEFIKKKSQEQTMSKEQLRDICRTNKPIITVPLQVSSDSVLQFFVPPKFRDQRELFNFA